MNPNLWQYLVLLEGLGAVATAAGIALEALRREPLKLVGYANVGVALISLSVVATLLANIASRPTIATLLAAAGFALYAVAVVASRAKDAVRLHLRRSWHPPTTRPRHHV